MQTSDAYHPGGVAPVLRAMQIGAHFLFLPLMLGGERVTDDVSARWGEGRRLFIGYGPAEATAFATWAGPLAPSDRPLIGRPARGIDAVVLDRRLQPVPPGVTGELYLAGDRLAAGTTATVLGQRSGSLRRRVAAACTGPETSCGGSRHRPVRCSTSADGATTRSRFAVCVSNPPRSTPYSGACPACGALSPSRASTVTGMPCTRMSCRRVAIRHGCVRRSSTGCPRR
ncbi:AMP-binding protein [Rhodococcus hoagii]|nr:AMP-binding protein [Prescottella equi]